MSKKEQTYIIYLENKNGILVDFERWAYKKLETCIDKTLTLHCRGYSLYKNDLIKTAKIVAYKTNDGNEIKVWDISINEYMEKLRRHKEWQTYNNSDWTFAINAINGQK